MIVLPQLLGDIAEERATQRPVSGGGGGIEGLLQQKGAFSRDADVGAQRTQRNSGRSRARASLCKWTFLCTRRSG